MKYYTEYNYEEGYLDKLILNFKIKNSKIWASLIPKEILKAKELNGLIKNETEVAIKFLKENNIAPYICLDFNDGIWTGAPSIKYFGPRSNELITALHEPYKTCVEPKNFIGKKWHRIDFSNFGNSEKFRENIKSVIGSGYSTSSFYSEVYENEEEIANIRGYLGKLEINSQKVLEGVRKEPKSDLKQLINSM